MENGAALENLGLTAGERKCYLALLETGVTTAGPLVKRTGMQKSAVYFCLEKLLEKGLASFVIRNNVKQFEGARPARIMDYLDAKGKELEVQRANIRKLLPELEKIAPKQERTMARVFEGWEGVKSAFDDVFETMKAGDEYLIFSMSPPPAIADRFRRFVARFHEERVRRKIPMRGVFSEDARGTIGADREKQKHTEIRYAPAHQSVPAVISIYADKLLLSVWAESPSAFIIQNKDVAGSFRRYFEVQWAVAKRGGSKEFKGGKR